MVEGKEHSLHHILNVYESDVLTLEAYREIDVLLDAFCHQEIVFLARSVNTCRSQYDVGKSVCLDCRGSVRP